MFLFPTKAEKELLQSLHPDKKLTFPGGLGGVRNSHTRTRLMTEAEWQDWIAEHRANTTFTITRTNAAGNIISQDAGHSLTEIETLPPHTGPGGRFIHLDTRDIRPALIKASKVSKRRRKPASAWTRISSVSQKIRDALQQKIDKDPDVCCEILPE